MWLKAVGEGKGSNGDDVSKDSRVVHRLLFLRRLFKSKVLFHTPLRLLWTFVYSINKHSLTPKIPDLVLGTGLWWQTRRTLLKQ